MPPANPNVQTLAPGMGPFPLRPATNEMAALSGALFRPHAPLPLANGLTAALVPWSGPLPEGAPWLIGTLNGHDAAISLSWGLVRQLAQMPLEHGGPEDAALLLEDALGLALNGAEAASDLAIRFAALGMAAPEADLPVDGVALRLTGDATYDLPLRLSQSAAERLAILVGRRALAPDLPADLPIPIALECGRVGLTPAELESLRTGDALLLGAQDQPLTLCLTIAGQMTAPVRQTETHIELTGPLRQCAKPEKGQPMTDPTDTATASPAAENSADASAPAPAAASVATKALQANAPTKDALVDSLELSVVVEAGTAHMTLGDLKQLGQGSILDLPGLTGTTVTLSVNNRRIGSGELITIGDRRAVQILSLDHHG